MKKNQYISIVTCMICVFFIDAFAHAHIKGTIQSASEFDYPPFSIISKDGKAEGFSVDLLRASLKAVDYDVEFKVGPWAEIKSELKEGKVQVLPLVGRTPERETIYDFTFTYLTLHGAIFVRKGDTRIKTADDLANKEIIVMQGDNAEEYVNRERISPHIISVDTYDKAMNLLASGKHDAVIAQRLMGIQLLKGLGITEIVPVEHKLDKFKQEIAFAVREGDRELLALLNEGLSIVMTDGTFERLHDKWFAPILGERLSLKSMFKYILIAGVPITILMLLSFTLYLRAEVKRKTKGLHQEIKERKIAEKALQDSETLFRSFTEKSPSGIFKTDIEGKCLYTNPGWCEMAGLTPEEALGDQWVEGIHPDDRELIFSNWHRMIDSHGKWSLEYRFQNKDGRITWVSGTAVPLVDKDGDTIGYLGTNTDITERKLAEEALLEEKKFTTTALNAQQDTFFLFEPSTGKAIRWNRAFNYITGYTDEEISSMPAPSSYYGTEDLKRAAIFVEKILKTGAGTIELELICKDGRKIPIEYNVAVIKDAYDNPKHIISIGRNISDRKKAEEEEKKAHKLESIGILAGGIAHDFNNILAGIVNNIYLAKMSVKPESKAYDNLISAEKAIHRAANLTQQLLTFSKGGAPIRKTASIVGIIKESAEFVLSGSNVTCEYHIAENLPPVEVDAGQISQAMQNLIINSNQAMPEGGTIRIRVEHSNLSEDSGFPLKAGRYIQIVIEDRGTGIKEEHLEKIFDPYFTTKEMGRGLGLSITYSIIRNHDGHMSVESEMGVGTTFTLYIPTSEKQIEENESAENALTMGQGKILLMDDEEMIRDSLGAFLTISGYVVEFAEDGEEALNLYQEAIATSKPFDAVILDLTVRGGMGGKETMMKLLDIDPNIKAIVSSGYSNDPVMANFRDYGFNGIISKPCKSPEELSNILHEVLKG